MPFDGVIPQPSAAIIALDNMIEFFHSRPDSWTSHCLCRGNRRNPTGMCLRGILNYTAFGNARAYFLWQRKNKKLWYQIDKAMKMVAIERFGTDSYISVNDSMLRNRFDAILFLRRTQNHLLNA